MTTPVKPAAHRWGDRIWIWLCYCALWLHLSVAAQSLEPRLRIAAAADMRFAMDEIVGHFRHQHVGTIDVIYGSTGKLTQQIQHGAPFDVFFAADINYTKVLHASGDTLDAGVHFANGSLVIWSLQHDVRQMPLSALLHHDVGHIAIASPNHAPYGRAAQQALERAGIWSAIQGKLVFGENVGQAAHFVKSGAADVAFIARSLLPRSNAPNEFDKTLTGFYRVISPNDYQPLQQSYALTSYGRDNMLAKQFLQFIQSEYAQQILRDYGFLLVDQLDANAQ